MPGPSRWLESHLCPARHSLPLPMDPPPATEAIGEPKLCLGAETGRGHPLQGLYSPGSCPLPGELIQELCLSGGQAIPQISPALMGRHSQPVFMAHNILKIKKCQHSIYGLYTYIY